MSNVLSYTAFVTFDIGGDHKSGGLSYYASNDDETGPGESVPVGNFHTPCFKRVPADIEVPG